MRGEEWAAERTHQGAGVAGDRTGPFLTRLLVEHKLVHSPSRPLHVVHLCVEEVDQPKDHQPRSKDEVTPLLVVVLCVRFAHQLHAGGGALRLPSAFRCFIEPRTSPRCDQERER